MPLLVFHIITTTAPISCPQVYVREVSFSAEAEALAYTYLPLSSDCAPTLPLSLSLSLLPLDGEGVVLAASDQVLHSELRMMTVSLLNCLHSAGE